MAFRVSWFFQLRQGLKVGGWTVNLYNNATDISVVQAKTDAMRQLMWTMTGSSVNLFAARIQDLDNFRAAVLVPYSYNTTYISDANANTDAFNTSALVKIDDGGKLTTRFWFRGVQDNAVTDNGQWRAAGSYLTTWNRFFSELKNGANLWVQRKLNRAVKGVFIQQITAAGVVTSATHGLVAGDKVRIGRVVFPKTLNRIFRVATRIDADNYTIAGPPPMTGNAIIGASTYGQKQTYQFVGIANAVVDRVSFHKTGRPFGLLSGRRKVVRA